VDVQVAEPAADGGDVRQAVTVEVGDGDRCRVGVDGHRLGGGGEPAGPVAQHQGDGAGPIVGHGQVGLAVAVEVGDVQGDRAGVRPDRERGGRLEGAVPVAQEDGDRVVRLVGGEQVE